MIVITLSSEFYRGLSYPTLCLDLQLWKILAFRLCQTISGTIYQITTGILSLLQFACAFLVTLPREQWIIDRSRRRINAAATPSNSCSNNRSKPIAPARDLTSRVGTDHLPDHADKGEFSKSDQDRQADFNLLVQSLPPLPDPTFAYRFTPTNTDPAVSFQEDESDDGFDSFPTNPSLAARTHYTIDTFSTRPYPVSPNFPPPRKNSVSDSPPPAPANPRSFFDSLPPLDYAGPPYGVGIFPTQPYPVSPYFPPPHKDPVFDPAPPVPTSLSPSPGVILKPSNTTSPQDGGRVDPSAITPALSTRTHNPLYHLPSPGPASLLPHKIPGSHSTVPASRCLHFHMIPRA